MAERLLVIENDASLRDVYLEHFSRSGFDVRCAPTVAEAEAVLSFTRFDAVIADVGGEAGSAEDLSSCLDAAGGPPVVVVTAYGAPARASDAARLRVDAFLHKPVSLVWLEWLLRSRIETARLAASGDAAL